MSPIELSWTAKKSIFVQIRLLCQDYDPDFLLKKLQQIFRKTKFEDIKPNVRKSKKGGSVKADFFCGGAS